jgi:hypothetical protein
VSDRGALVLYRPPDPAVDQGRWLAAGRARHGRGYLSQLIEMWRRARGPSKLPPADWFTYRMFEPRMSAEVKDSFVGLPFVAWLNEHVLHSPWVAWSADNLAVLALLEGLSIPIPRVLAVVHPQRLHGAAETVPQLDGLLEFLRRSGPCFGKPATYMGGVGMLPIDGVEGDQVRLGDGRLVPAEMVLTDVGHFAGQHGYQLQERLRSAEGTRAACGEAPTSLRFLVFQDVEGPVIWRVAWRMCGGPGVIDTPWRPGNLLAAVHAESGEVKRVVRGFGPEHAEVTRHPLTATELVGLRVPGFDAARRLVHTAAQSIPLCSLAAWDVALTDRGPVVLGFSGGGGDPRVTQLPFSMGWNTGRFVGWCDDMTQSAVAHGASAQAGRRSVFGAIREVWRRR